MNLRLNLRDFQISKKEQKSINGGNSGGCESTCTAACDYYIPVLNQALNPNFDQIYADNKDCVNDCKSFC